MKHSDKPNILFYFSDQQRHDTAGCYGQPLNITPVLDSLAAEGAVFDNAFTCQPVCGPARATLQTGMYPEALGCYRNAIALPKDTKTLAEYMEEAGYDTGYVGKWHLASTLGKSHDSLESEADYEKTAIPADRRGGYRGWWTAADVLEATSHGYGGYLFDAGGKKLTFDGYRTDAVTDLAIDYLDTQKDAQKPFFLFLSHLEPHHQNDHDCFEGPDGSKQRFSDFIPPSDLTNAPGDWGKNWQEQYPDYLGCCRSIDDNLGRIVAALDETGQRENTVIIFASDHGSHFRTRCMEYKRSCHEASIHVPLVINGGDFGQGVRFNELVSLVDLPPTILQIAGIPVPEAWHGYPVQNIKNDPDSWQKEVFLQISESQVGRAIRTDRYTYSVRAYDKNPWLDARSPAYHEEYLYDLQKDPDEVQNFIHNPDYSAVRSNLRARLIHRMFLAGEEAPVILAPLPASTVDLGLNGLLIDYLKDSRYSKLIIECFPKMFDAIGQLCQDINSQKSEALNTVTIKMLPELFPEQVSITETDQFLKKLINVILGM